MNLLIIDPDREQSGLFADRLKSNGFKPKFGHSPQQVIADGMATGIEAVLLDNGMRATSATSHVKLLRDAGVIQPLIVLSVLSDWRDKVDCLDAGADDFLVKPVRSEEIAARVRALVRRGAGQSTDRVTAGPLDLDIKARCAWLDGKYLDLTRNEYHMLRHFMLNPGQVIDHGELLDHLSGGGEQASRNAAEVQIARLRKKLGPGFIQTVRGLGYRFVNDVSEAGSEGSENNSSCCRAER